MSDKTFVEKTLQKIKNNKLLGGLIVFGIIVISFSKFIKASEEIYDIGSGNSCEIIKKEINQIGSEINQKLNNKITHGDILLLNDLINRITLLYLEANNKNACKKQLEPSLEKLKSLLFSKIYSDIEIWEKTNQEDLRKKINDITEITKKFIQKVKLANTKEIKLLNSTISLTNE